MAIRATPDLWQTCDGKRRIAPMHGELVRVVENQEQIATTALVDDLQEQALLEKMLDDAKPRRGPENRRENRCWGFWPKPPIYCTKKGVGFTP